MPRKVPRRATYSGELKPLVPRKISPIVKFLHPPKGRDPPKEVPTRKRKKNWKPKHELPKRKIPFFQMYKPNYWELGMKPKKKNFLKKCRKKQPCEPLRKSLTLGTIVILLAGRHKAKRCIFLKQLTDSGTLLCCGPKRLNGIGLIRIPQAYVIATKTKVDLTGIKLVTKSKKNPERTRMAIEEKLKKVTDKWFKEAKIYNKEKKWVNFKKGVFLLKRAERPKKFKCPKILLLGQASREINKAVMKVVQHNDQDHLLRQYLSSKFRLTGKDKPHEMIF